MNIMSGLKKETTIFINIVNLQKRSKNTRITLMTFLRLRMNALENFLQPKIFSKKMAIEVAGIFLMLNQFPKKKKFTLVQPLSKQLFKVKDTDYGGLLTFSGKNKM